MAQGSKTQVEVTKTVTVKEDVIRLDLSPAEARTLRDVLSNISGFPSSSRRQHTDAIAIALDGAGVRFRPSDTRTDQSGEIHFA